MKETLSPDFAEILKTYREYNFDIFDWRDGNIGTPTPHRIRFHGDYPDQGYRAADLALEKRFRISSLNRIWDYFDYLYMWELEETEEQIRPFWEICFLTYEQHMALFDPSFRL